MNLFKKITAIALVIVFTFTSLPMSLVDLGGLTKLFAQGTTPVNISFENFADTTNLQLNGEAIIQNNAIRFDASGGGGESVHTASKLTLSENLSFSTAFSFRHISPTTPTNGSEGGFIFTLQPDSNSLVTDSFQYENISPNLNIAFATNYSIVGPAALLNSSSANLPLSLQKNIVLNNVLRADALLNKIIPAGITLAQNPPSLCHMSVVPYLNGAYHAPISEYPVSSYYTAAETSEYYHVWIGYDGTEKQLYILYQLPLGGGKYEYRYSSDFVDLSSSEDSEATIPNELYAGFMGSIGNAGNTTEISSWYFKNDLSIWDEAIADADLADLNSLMENIESDPISYYNFPLIGSYGSIISWTSSNPDVIAANGTVTPPSLGEENQMVKLTATISKGSAVRTTREFTITVKVPGNEIIDADYIWLTDETLKNENTDLNNIISDLYLPPQGLYNSTIVWETSNALVADVDGKVIRPTFSEGDKEVTLTAYLTMGDYSNNKTFNIIVKALGMNDEDIMQADYFWLTASQLLGSNPSLNRITSDMNLPTTGQYGSTISWESSDSEVLATTGDVTRPTYVTGDKEVTLTATISKGIYSETKEFALTVIRLDKSDAEMLDEDFAWLTKDEILKENTSLDNIIGDMLLHIVAPNGSTISWESSNTDVVDATGKVTRPTYILGDKTVTLTATIMKGLSTKTKDFTVTVIKNTQTDTEIFDADVKWLTDNEIRKDNTSLESVTSDLHLPTLGPSGSTIKWSSNKALTINISGKVTRQPFPYDEIVTLTATVSKGVISTTKTFTVRVISLEQTDEQKVDADLLFLTNQLVLDKNDFLHNITSNLYLPVSGDNGSVITWESSNEAIVDTSGVVNRLPYASGNQIVTLEATISSGAVSKTKKIIITVIALDQTDTEKVEADLEWLIDSQILNTNTDLDNILVNLSLSTKGQYGSIISWESSNTSIVSNSGQVTRPAYALGDMEVTLTATLNNGTATAGKTFTLTVRRLNQTPMEMVLADEAWLTDSIILNGNSSLDSITGNLSLPTIGGIHSSTISWYSVYSNVVTTEGVVTRPSYMADNKEVTIRATISRSGGSVMKEFKLVVKSFDMTDIEATFLDFNWLYNQNVLSMNASANSVTQNLSFPILGPNKSTITWSSDTPTVISNKGSVNRPENGEGHKSVKITATISKGDGINNRTYSYVVLEKPDTTVPTVVTTSPSNNSTEVMWDIGALTIEFSENIVWGAKALDNKATFGLELHSTDSARFSARIEKNKLIITPFGDLSSGENKLIIPYGTVKDEVGNEAEAFVLSFNVQSKPVRTIRVLSTSPQNLENNVDPDIKEFNIKFDLDQLLIGDNIENITLSDELIGFTPTNFTTSIDEDTLVLKTWWALDEGEVYRLLLPAGVVKDKFGNINEESSIRFRLRYKEETPRIISISPANGQTNVNISQRNIDITFSSQNKILLYDNKLKLTDEKGNEYKLMSTPRWYGNTLKVHPVALAYFEPNTVYTLSGPYATEDNPTAMEFSSQFRTSENGLMLLSTSPRAGKTSVPFNTQISLDYNNIIEKGTSFDSITIKDSQGGEVEFDAFVEGKRVLLTPKSNLESLKDYYVTLPGGAVKDGENGYNDSYTLTFTTLFKYEFNPNIISVGSSGVVGKEILFFASEIERIAATWGNARITSYEWRSNGERIGTNRDLLFHKFSSAGTHEIQLLVRDNWGNTYEFNKSIEIKELSEIRMKAVGQSYFGGQIAPSVIETFAHEDFYKGVILRATLEQGGFFIHGETINVDLYKNGVLVRELGDISATYSDSVYKFTYKPDFMDYGTYEVVFTYDGMGYEQVARFPVVVKSDIFYSSEFKFRLLDTDLSNAYQLKYYDNPNSLDVNLAGSKLKAVKKWDSVNNYYYYSVDLNKRRISAYSDYSFTIEGWSNSKANNLVYVRDDKSPPETIYGRFQKPGEIKTISINEAESSVKNPNFVNLFFEGVSSKLVLNVEGDWGKADAGYYEIFTYKDDSFNLKVNCTNKSGIQKIILDPGVQLKKGDKLGIRMVTKQGVTSAWTYLPTLYILPQPPKMLGQRVTVSIQSGEYVVNWPTVFDSIMGDSIGFLDGVPVLDGANFGINADMPEFSGELSGNAPYPYIDLEYNVSGGYGESSKTKTDTKYKKLKKVKVVGYEFQIALDGGFQLDYESALGEWRTGEIYFLLTGDLDKKWEVGYEILGIGFSAGVGIGGTLYGGLKLEEINSKMEYSGIVGIAPRAYLYVDGDFKLASVEGKLIGRIPAEIHFPTHYIGADITVNASIYAKALLWGGYIYEKQLFGVHWDNGNPKVVIKSKNRMMDSLTHEEPIDFQLTARDYINRGSNWLGGNETMPPRESIGTLASMRGLSLFGASNQASKPSESALMEGIYPSADPKLIRNGDDLWLLWTDDNPLRDAANRTQLRYSVQKNGAWSAPKWLDDDGTADFGPTIAASGDGVLVAWHNLGKVVTEEEGLGGALQNSEISVTNSVYTADSTNFDSITLTSDDLIDHSPVLAADGDKALLAWTKSESLGFSLGEESTEPANVDQLYYSAWENGIWSEATPIGDALYTILDSSLSMAGDDGLILYTLDRDNDLSTYEDREVFAQRFDGKTWSEAIRLSNNSLNDSAPKAVNVNGQWFITWQQDGSIIYKNGLEGESKVEEQLSNVQGDYQLTVRTGGEPLVALTYTSAGEDNSKGISCYFYDVDKGQWGGEVSLVAPDKYVDGISTMFDDDGRLNIAFTQAEIFTEAVPMVIDGVEELVELPAVSNKVDMKLISYTPVHDVALLDEDGILLSKEFPLPGTVMTVYTVLRNEGDFSDNAKISIYDGNPNNGGKLIGESPHQQIPARSTKEIEIEWIVAPEEKSTYDLYAVVQPSDGVQEIDTVNNTIHLEFSNADLAITHLICENVFGNDYRVDVTIANAGATTIEGATLLLENISDDGELENISVRALEPGEQDVLTILVSSGGLTKDENGQVNLRVKVIAPEGVHEDFLHNNIRDFKLVPSAISVDTANPGPVDMNVDPSSVIELSFNMSISEGTAYDQILLIDDNTLNKIEISKAIDGRILTITPEDDLNKGSQYRVIIPKNALDDDFGHKLEQEFTLSFTTMSPYPSVISAYPGAAMEEAVLNTDIMLRFNQSMSSGYDASKIKMYTIDDEEVHVVSSFNNDTLSLSYSGLLSENTRYILEIPRGAAQNSMGEFMEDDYIMSFTTGETTDEGENEDQGGTTTRPWDNNKNNYQASIDIGERKSALVVQTDDDKAIIKLGDLVKEIFSGNQSSVLEIPNIQGIASYSVEMPARALAESGESTLTINTAFGSIYISSDMMSNRENAKEDILVISISTVDKSTISAEAGVGIGNKPAVRVTMTINGGEIVWRNQDAPVRISIPYEIMVAEMDRPESIVILHIDGDSNISVIPNAVYDSQEGTIAFRTSHLGIFAIGYNDLDFNDVTAGIWYEKAVRFIASRGITVGTGNGDFSPLDSLTRGQFITMMMRAYSIEPDVNPVDNFSDAGNTYYTGYIAAAKRLGIAAGVGNNMFVPDTNITRQEMFALLYNALKAIKQLPEATEADKLISGRKLSDYEDEAQISSWAREAMTVMVQTGNINGSGGKLTPYGTTTRAQMAQVLYNIFN